MLYQLRTGDVILCANKPLNRTNAYLIVYDTDNGFGLWCLGCGEALGFYGDDIEKMKMDILNKDFLNIQSVIPKELISEYLNSQCKLAFPIKAHNGFHELNIVIELGE